MNDNTGLFTNVPRSSSRIRVNALRDAEMELERILPDGDVAVQSLKKMLDKREEKFQHEMDEFVVEKIRDNDKVLKEEFKTSLNDNASALRKDFRSSLGEMSEIVVRVNDRHQKFEARSGVEVIDHVHQLEEQLKAMKTSHEEEVRDLKDCHNKLKSEAIDHESHFEEQVKAIKISHEEEVRGLKDRCDELKNSFRSEAQKNAIKASRDEEARDTTDCRLEEIGEALNCALVKFDEQLKAIKTSHEDEVRDLKGELDNMEEKLRAETHQEVEVLCNRIEKLEVFSRKIDGMDLELYQNVQVDGIKTQEDKIDDLNKEIGKLEGQIEQYQKDFDKLKLENEHAKKRFDEAVLSGLRSQVEECQNNKREFDMVLSRVCSKVTYRDDSLINSHSTR